jgi:hypothetical protein
MQQAQAAVVQLTTNPCVIYLFIHAAKPFENTSEHHAQNVQNVANNFEKKDQRSEPSTAYSTTHPYLEQFSMTPLTQTERRTYAKGFASSFCELCLLNVLRAEDSTNATMDMMPLKHVLQLSCAHSCETLTMRF